MTRRLLSLLIGAALLAGCGSEAAQAPQPPKPGAFALTLTAPDDSTGGALITLAGGPVDSVVPVGSLTYGTATTTETGATVFLAGELTPGAVVASVYVPDVNRIAEYRVAVTDAANGVTKDQRASGIGASLAPSN